MIQEQLTIPASRPLDVKFPLTGEEFYRLGDIGPAELVKGEIVFMAPAGHPHGYIEVNFAAILRDFVRQHKLGRVYGGEVGIYTARNPDTVRGADVAFVSSERLARLQSPSYLDVAPDLVVEIMSPDDRWSEVMAKLAEYFAIGVRVVWVADPKTRSVYVYCSLTDAQRYTDGDTLPSDEVLPGFAVPVNELFEAE